ncbi:hypothetical protein EON68_04095, partial [archaeon]
MDTLAALFDAPPTPLLQLHHVMSDSTLVWAGEGEAGGSATTAAAVSSVPPGSDPLRSAGEVPSSGASHVQTSGGDAPLPRAAATVKHSGGGSGGTMPTSAVATRTVTMAPEPPPDASASHTSTSGGSAVRAGAVHASGMPRVH